MKKVLMILTHNRTDCLQLDIDMLLASGSLSAFDHVVLLLNGIPRSHRVTIERIMHDNPHIRWDTLEGPGTRPAGLVGLQNACVRKYPDALYVKIDDDVFVPYGWARRMFEVYEQFKDRDNLALISPLIPNNALGLHALLTRFYPEHLAEHLSRFGCAPSPDRQGFTWHSPAVAEWATRLFLDINAANVAHRKRLEAQGAPSCIEFNDSFSVGCICYDYRHWTKMGGVPPRDEPEWCEWIAKNNGFNVLDCAQIVLHYAFFVQQEWLDRSTLLEDIRRTNLPDTQPALDATLARTSRVTRQIPGILRRRLTRS